MTTKVYFHCPIEGEMSMRCTDIDLPLPSEGDGANAVLTGMLGGRRVAVAIDPQHIFYTVEEIESPAVAAPEPHPVRAESTPTKPVQAAESTPTKSVQAPAPTPEPAAQAPDPTPPVEAATPTTTAAAADGLTLVGKHARGVTAKGTKTEGTVIGIHKEGDALVRRAGKSRSARVPLGNLTVLDDGGNPVPWEGTAVEVTAPVEATPAVAETTAPAEAAPAAADDDNWGEDDAPDAAAVVTETPAAAPAGDPDDWGDGWGDD